MKRFSGLFRTIFIASIVCMLVPLFITTVITVSSLSKNLNKSMSSNLQQLAVEKVNEVDLFIKNQVQFTKYLIESPYVVEELTERYEKNDLSAHEPLIKYLQNVFNYVNGLYENIFIVCKTMNLATGIPDTKAGLRDVTGEPWLVECENKGGYIGNNVSPITGRPVYVISYAIKSYDGRMVGAINNSIDLATMTGTITNSVNDENTKVLILDSQGNVIASQNSEHILKVNFKNDKEKSMVTAFDKIASSKTGIVTFVFDGTEVVGAYSTENGMTALVYMPKSIYYKAINDLVFKIIICAVLCLFLTAVIITFISASITRPLKIVNNAIHEIATGDADLTKRITGINVENEVGSLVKSFNAFAQKLQEIVSDIKDSQDELEEVGDTLQGATYDTESSITEILANVKSVNDRILGQSSVVDGTSGAVNDISTSIEMLEQMVDAQTESVKNASSAVGEMLENIHDVNAFVEMVTTDFYELTKDVTAGTEKQKDVSNKIKQIEEQSNLLQEANKTISSIASQTNLLAMNAAIEAAHAGEAGRGFSVVADEIRKLSETSSGQSKTISEQIKQIKNSIMEVVNACADSQKAFDKIADTVEKTDSEVHNIKNSMNEQHENSRKIDESLKEMAGSTNKVHESAVGITDGSKTILTKIGILQDSTLEMRQSVEEMQVGASKISKTGAVMTEVSSMVKNSIAKSNEQVSKFKI